MDKEQLYMKALEWIHGLGRFGVRPGLERISALLEMLGNPHHRIRFVHIGGTNGKGSTAAMLASALRAAGYRIGLYTSPYLLSFTNRMAVNGNDIDHGELIELVNQAHPLVENISSDPRLGPLTEFEVVTALALTYFSRQDVDLVVLEVGLGGRLDATNVVDPLLSIITNISLEHTDVLGNTIEAIAAEKAGIIKEGRPLLTAADDQKVLNLFQGRCENLNASFNRVILLPGHMALGTVQTPYAVQGRITEDGQFFDYSGIELQLKDLFIPLRGAYQVINAGTAIAALEILKKENIIVDENSIREGLAVTNWPGRLELLSKNPLLIMDGAHNPAAMKKLAESLPAYFRYNKLILVVGMLEDKDTGAMLRDILPLADTVVFTKPTLPRAAEPSELADFAVKNLNLGNSYQVLDEHGRAIDIALELAGPEDAVLVTGSLYTVSDVRAYWHDKNG